MAKVPQTFRCHIRVRGEQCPCEMTLVNTFTYSVPTLDRKAQAAGEKRASVKTLAATALCPWHARFLGKLRKDIFRMGVVADVWQERERQLRKTEAARSEVRARNEYLTKRFMARQPTLGAALLEAGIRR